MDIYKNVEYFFSTITFEWFIKFLTIYFLIIWWALLIWVIRDITNRTNNVLLLILSVLTILLLSPLWIFIYLIIRPNKTLFEKSYNNLEDNIELLNQMVQEKAEQLEYETHCFNCWDLVKNEFNYCPNCKSRLKVECKNCKKIVQETWNNCPYCWVEKPEKVEKKENKKNTKS